MLALGRSGYAALGARVPLHRLLIGGSGAAAVLYVVCALAQSPLLGVLACGLTGLCVSLLWPGAIILASRRIPSAGAAMFALLSAGGDVGASLGAFCVGRAADWAQASGTVFAGAAGESGALRAGLLLAAVFPLLCCGVHTALHCSEARAGLPAGSERRRRQEKKAVFQTGTAVCRRGERPQNEQTARPSWPRRLCAGRTAAKRRKGCGCRFGQLEFIKLYHWRFLYMQSSFLSYLY